MKDFVKIIVNFEQNPVYVRFAKYCSEHNT